MELASMLAGEPFTDHPASVCPVIGSFLRSYNDQIDSKRRQDLYAYASRVVGSWMGEDVERARIDRLVEWVLELERHRLTRFVLLRRWRRLSPVQAREAVVTRAMVNVCRRVRSVHPQVLQLVDDLLLIGRPGETPVEAVPDARASSDGRVRVMPV
jgi:hypothetical protein